MKNIQPTEPQLIESAQHGCMEAFNQLVLKYQDMMYRISLRILNDESSADDATQNAMIQAFRNMKSFRGGSFRNWLARVTVNASYDEMRRWRRQASLSFEQVNHEGEEIESLPWMMDLTAGPEERYETVELGSALQHCVKTLNSEYRLVVVLVDVEGLSYKEVARVANIPVGTVKSRLARARMQLRKSLQSTATCFQRLIRWVCQPLQEHRFSEAWLKRVKFWLHALLFIWLEDVTW